MTISYRAEKLFGNFLCGESDSSCKRPRSNAAEKYKEIVMKTFHRGVQTGTLKENVIKSKPSGFQVLVCHDGGCESKSLSDASPNASCVWDSM